MTSTAISNHEKILNKYLMYFIHIKFQNALWRKDAKRQGNYTFVYYNGWH